MNEDDLQTCLAGSSVSGWRYFASVGSTNDIALEWAEHGALDFSLVVADEQTAGRGRMQRKWVTRPDSALAFSLVLRLSAEEVKKASLLPLLAGAAVASALKQSLSLQPQIKWPNDILLDGRKTAGILVESAWQGGQATAVIGVGVNISPEALPVGEKMMLPAACVQEFAGQSVDRWQLLASIVNSLRDWRIAPPETLIHYIGQHLAYLGRPVRIINNHAAEINGMLTGIDSNGCLRLATGYGEELIQAGDVHLRLNTD